MGFSRLFLILFSLTMIVLAFPAFAQDKVAARTGSHAGYSRLVFEWPAKPAYTISKEGGRLLVRFSKQGTLDKAGVSSDERNVKGLELLSAAGEPLQVAISIPDGSRFRDFIVENKLVIDIYNAKGEAAAEKKPVPSAAEEKPEKPEKPKPQEAKKGDFTISPAKNEEAAPIHPVEAAKVNPPAIAPHVISMTSTQSTGLSVFTRTGNLWIVMDTPSSVSSPQMTGPQKDRFTELEKIDIPNGRLYRMELPEGINAYAEGGGLSWRIILTPETRGTKPALPSVLAEEGGTRLVWPVKGARKVLSFTDPIVGDTVTAITANQADQYAGPGRRFVDLQSFDSVVGLAYAARTDDVTAKVTPSTVDVSSASGLSVSQEGDVTPAQIRQAMKDTPKAEDEPEAAPAEKTEEKAQEKTEEKHEDKALDEHAAPEEHASDEHATGEHEEAHAEVPAATTQEMAEATSEKPSGNNIYNFPRWSMGGIRALDKNQHAMMAAISNKPEAERTEDILTLAKINIANNRAPESLGLLRIALQQVPELEDNAEFLSVRAAARALAGKYDEAFTDLNHGNLSKYDDIRYWRAYVLAVLEDWKQAIAVMPTSLDPISAYPKEIRIPFLLTFAEVALRGGKVPLAENILKRIEPDAPHLPLAYAASYQYLMGETQRQKGLFPQAEELWTSLTKDGKDDLFRAKAGLSLTKLQLDEKKIKAADAINILEGLRYAWRGDELETLINYRLGQMYVDNKDYLKGLTVWNNASTFSPGTQIAQDVKIAMANTFRDVFANNRLNDISPLEAISLYEEFKALTPPGDEGNRVVEKLAERLVDADLLGRAAALLEYHVNNRLQGDRKAGIAIRLAAIRLLDGNPAGGLRSLEIAEAALNNIETGAGGSSSTATDAKAGAPAKADPEKRRQIKLLRARALSMQKKPDEAIETLRDMRIDPDVNRLRADIAWGAGKWEDAAMALNDLITTEDISPKRPLTDYQRDIIFNRAIALNLSDNRVALANLRERYNTQMKDTTKGQMFEIVTRPRRPDMIGSREAIASMISEIDLFKGFLDGYGKMQNGKGAKDVSPAKEPVPAGEKPASVPENNTPAEGAAPGGGTAPAQAATN